MKQGVSSNLTADVDLAAVEPVMIEAIEYRLITEDHGRGLFVRAVKLEFIDEYLSVLFKTVRC